MSHIYDILICIFFIMHFSKLFIFHVQANSMDDDGVLEGRWTEEYPKDCVLPWNWTGSVKILAQYMNTGKPVQYGQCWVFSGLVTSCKYLC